MCFHGEIRQKVGSKEKKILSMIDLKYFLIYYLQWLPESARFDMTRGNRERALATLERIAKENGKPMPLGKLVEPSLKVRYCFN